MASSHCSRRLLSISSFKSAFRPTTTNHSHSPRRQFSPFFISGCWLASCHCAIRVLSNIGAMAYYGGEFFDNRRGQFVKDGGAIVFYGCLK
ncbi:hypothetical protein TSUD_391370 [Trifolium subterraneum]|uniref:Uncharacterized protein n=1 Tax=Trifolium subterraneum TaxID=3900 RepID=A0A2Z6N5D3_TRISU|nr:hypothetical protein TSUD_391370 [Trifolium subterraneum]